MKTINTFLAFLIIRLFFTACTENVIIDSPDQAISPTAVEQPGLTFLKVIDPALNKGRPVKTTQYLSDIQYVTWEDGGELEVIYKGTEFNNGDVFCKVTLQILSQTISMDTDVELTLSTSALWGNVDMTFEPHGITFAKPALLNIEARNLDLSGIDTKTIALYYDNPETGKWELMNVQKIIIRERDGYINIIDGELPHFSRYAVAYGR